MRSKLFIALVAVLFVADLIFFWKGDLDTILPLLQHPKSSHYKPNVYTGLFILVLIVSAWVLGKGLRKKPLSSDRPALPSKPADRKRNTDPRIKNKRQRRRRRKKQ